MSKPDEIKMWATVDGNGNHNMWTKNPRWLKKEKCWWISGGGIILHWFDAPFFDGLEPGHKRPVTLTVKLGKAVKG